ncbi:chromosomal replication initiator protein DnaA [Aliidongia dinghuensis]|uniref:Chromosomal replication initiator protein DnaA n=1 Tax=Aliidongia dinghuensis TaxID=1867774 RepID=A0A8J3E4D9_9PROT|nr:chromosomal replication initiator protein DnaA [Aliidongia dinghuensis]GGF37918.1 chromosomal replication initiator protein DnaA [Aliidongia dinghuensis]
MTVEISEIDGPLAAQWQRVRGRLRDEFGEAAYRSWLSSLSLADMVGDAIRIEVPTRFLRDWVVAHYADRIQALWSGENKNVNVVEIVVGDRRVAAAALVAEPALVASAEPEPRLSEPAEEAGRAGAAATVTPVGDAADDREISAPLDPRFTFENFVVGKPNELAHAAARRVAESAVSGNRAAPFNPLFLYGGVGLGKTHLMHAIAWHIRRHDSSRRVIYLSAEKFMYQFIKALRFKDTMAFKEQFRSVDVLMIDDVQFISGKDSTQEEFFHTFNALVDQNRQVIISADKSPSDLEGMEERMKSRLGWGLVADIHPTTYELRLGILQAKAEQKQAQVPAKVLEFLAHKITSNVRELEGALTRITAHAQLVGRSITLESAQDVLHDLLRANDRRITIEEIQKRVAEHFNIRLADMHSARRARAVARPRQVAMYLCKQLTPRSLPEIGRKFGGRDHTTVMHAVRKIEELLAEDRALGEDIDLLRRMLES